MKQTTTVESNLIDGTWDETWEFFFGIFTKDEWKRRTHCWSSLNSRKTDFPNRICFSQTKDSYKTKTNHENTHSSSSSLTFDLIVCDRFLNSTNVLVKVWTLTKREIEQMIDVRQKRKRHTRCIQSHWKWTFCSCQNHKQWYLWHFHVLIDWFLRVWDLSTRTSHHLSSEWPMEHQTHLVTIYNTSKRHSSNLLLFLIDITLSWWMEPSDPNAWLLMMDHDQCTNRMVSVVHMHLILIRDLYKS